MSKTMVFGLVCGALLFGASPGAPEPTIIAVPLSNDAHQFSLVDNPSSTGHLTVASVFHERKALCVVNGGFFDQEFKPIGYYKVDGKVLASRATRAMSGYVCIDAQGRLSLHFKEADPEQYVSVFQAGPFLVDPGGKPGIASDDGKEANRTCLVQRDDGSFVFLYHSRITLYSLSQYILDQYPDADRALNLDGGPEAGIATRSPSLAIKENTLASKAYLVATEKKKGP